MDKVHLVQRLREQITLWRAMAMAGQRDMVPGDEAGAISRWTAVDLCAAELERLLTPRTQEPPPTELVQQLREHAQTWENFAGKDAKTTRLLREAMNALAAVQPTGRGVSDPALQSVGAMDPQGLSGYITDPQIGTLTAERQRLQQEVDEWKALNARRTAEWDKRLEKLTNRAIR